MTTFQQTQRMFPRQLGVSGPGERIEWQLLQLCDQSSGNGCSNRVIVALLGSTRNLLPGQWRVEEHQSLGGQQAKMSMGHGENVHKLFALFQTAEILGIVTSILPSGLCWIIGGQSAIQRQCSRQTHPTNTLPATPCLPTGVTHSRRRATGKVQNAHRGLGERAQQALAEATEQPGNAALSDHSVVGLSEDAGEAT